ncbi:MAG: hypothetical protein V4603_02430 [Pseudomonadota bacterium]
MTVAFTSTLIDQIIKGRCPDFAQLMGMQRLGTTELRVNVFLPGVQAVDVVSSNGKRVLGPLQRLHAEGLFSGNFPGKKKQDYRLRLTYADSSVLQDDPYRHSPLLDSAELQLFSQGRHEQAWQLLGAHPRVVGDSEGVHFVLWAPLSRRVSVLLQRSHWDGRVHVMHHHAQHGLWELFVPGLQPEAHYKFELMDDQQRTTVLCYDPFARQVEPQPAFCSRVVAPHEYLWRDHFWQLQHSNQSSQGMPLALHELTIGENLVVPGVHWQQLAALLLPQIRQQGFTHLLLRDANACAIKSQQVQPALLAAVPGLGSCEALQTFVEEAHEQDLAVIWDLSLVALLGAHGLPLQLPLNIDLHTLGGPLASIILGCIGYWHQQLHIDGFRLRELDLLLSMPVGGKTAARGRRNTGTDNPFAREWLSQLLARIRDQFPSLLLLAETTVSWPELTLPASKGGLGFDYRMTAPVLPTPFIAHEVGLWLQQSLQLLQDGNRLQHLLSVAPVAGADPELQQLLMLALWSLPGRKHMRLDCQLTVGSNWQPESGHDWELRYATALCDARKTLLKELNFLYQGNPCLYELDATHEGINVLHCMPTIIAFERLARHGGDSMLVLINTADEACSDIRLRPAQAARYRLCCRGGSSNTALPDQLQPVNGDNTGTLSLSLPGRTAAVYTTTE